jgi:IS30 family transposase
MCPTAGRSAATCDAACALARRCATRAASGCPRAAASSSTPSRIHQRPAEATSARLQDREGDLVLGKRPSAVLTLVERTSRAVLLVALPAGWRAEQVRPALTAP